MLIVESPVAGIAIRTCEEVQLRAKNYRWLGGAIVEDGWGWVKALAKYEPWRS